MNPSLPETCAIIPSSATTVALAREPFLGVLLTWLGRPPDLGYGPGSSRWGLAVPGGEAALKTGGSVAPVRGDPTGLVVRAANGAPASAAAGRATYGRAPRGRTSAGPGARSGVTRAK